MKRFHFFLTLAIAFSMVAIAQNAPKGKMLPFNKVVKQKTMVAPSFRAPNRVAPPATATIETDWTLEGGYINNSTAYTNSNTISVAIDGNDVYIQGLVFLCPDAWLNGTISEDGTTVTFANGQYAGMYNETPIYACGSDDGSTVADIVFSYDAASKRMELTNYYIENTEIDSFSFYFYSYNLVLYKSIEVPAPTNVEVEPAATSAAVAWTENGDAASWNLRYRYMPEKLNYKWDFEDVAQLAGWYVLDNDGDGHTWSYANSGFTTVSGNGLMVSESYSNTDTLALTPDNWLITPEIPMGGTASFWYRGQDASYCSEVFAVYVMVGSELTSLDQFVQVGEDITATADYQQCTIDLSAYEGVGRIAIRHYNVTDMFVLNVDDFVVEQPGGEYPGEWTLVEGVTENPYTINGLTPESNYQVQVQSVGEVLSAWSATTGFTTLAEVVVKKGDVNNDGSVDIADATTLIDHLLSQDYTDTDDFNSANADVNNDGAIDIADVTALIDMLLAGN